MLADEKPAQDEKQFDAVKAAVAENGERIAEMRVKHDEPMGADDHRDGRGPEQIEAEDAASGAAHRWIERSALDASSRRTAKETSSDGALDPPECYSSFFPVSDHLALPRSAVDARQLFFQTAAGAIAGAKCRKRCSAMNQIPFSEVIQAAGRSAPGLRAANSGAGSVRRAG